MSEATLVKMYPPNNAEEGTHHQSVLRSSAKLQKAPSGLFSALDLDYADAVHRDAASVVFLEKDERAVRRKMDTRILPMIFCGFMFNRLNRSNIGNTHIIESFNDTYEVTSNQRYTLSLSIYYVGYCLVGIPAIVWQRRIGANKFFFASIAFGGLASLSFVYAKGYPALVVLRLLLGIGDAGYQAGMIYYLSFWYKRHELAMRVSLTLSVALTGAVGGLLAFCLVRVNTHILSGWQLLILSEAVPTLLTAMAILLFLPAFPFTATFLSPREKSIVQARVNRDHKPQSHGGMSGWQGFKCIIADPHAWMFTLIYASFNMGPATIIYILPNLIENLGYSPLNSQVLSAAPYALSYFLVFVLARHSDHRQERGWHIMGACLWSTIGYIILATTTGKTKVVAYLALFQVVSGVFSLQPLVMSWAANTFSPTSKRGVGSAFIVSVSNCLSVIAPQIYFDPEDGFRKGHAICAGCLFFSFCVTFVLHSRFKYLNKKNRDSLPVPFTPKGNTIIPDDDTTEIWDNDPRYIFTT